VGRGWWEGRKEGKRIIVESLNEHGIATSGGALGGAVAMFLVAFTVVVSVSC
jgi:hypothetical protein